MDKESIINIIDNEPEFPGSIPWQLWLHLKAAVDHNDTRAVEEILRAVVRATKKNIKNNIENYGQSKCTNSASYLSGENVRD